MKLFFPKKEKSMKIMMINCSIKSYANNWCVQLVTSKNEKLWKYFFNKKIYAENL